jgi:hypothetical protein
MSLPHLSFDRSDHLPMKTEENGDDSNFLCRKAILSPIRELDEPEVLERHTSLDRDSVSSCAEVAKTTFSGCLVSDDDRRFWGLSQRGCTPDAPPIWTLPSPRSPAVPTSKRRVYIAVTLEREEVTHLSLASLRLSEPPPHLASSSRIDPPLPVFPQIILPRFSLSPSGIRKVLERRFASSETRNGQSNVEVGSAAPDPPLDGFPGSVQNGEFRSTGICRSKRTWNCLSLTIIVYSLIIKKPHRCPAAGPYRCPSHFLSRH